MRLKAICLAFFIGFLQFRATTPLGVVEAAIMVGPLAGLHGRFVPVRCPAHPKDEDLSVKMDLSERLVNREVVHQGTYMQFTRDTVLDPEGKEHTRDVVLHPGAVTVVA